MSIVRNLWNWARTADQDIDESLGALQPIGTRGHVEDADQSPKPMQVQDRLGTIDVAGIAGRRRDSPIERLPELADDERLLAMSGGNGLIKLPKCVACVRIHRTDDVMARSKP